MGYLDNSGLSYLWSKLKATFLRGVTRSVTISSSLWTLSGSYYIQSVTVSGVTSSNNVVIDSADTGIEAYSQSSNTLGFRTFTKPSTNVTIKVFIFT